MNKSLVIWLACVAVTAAETPIQQLYIGKSLEGTWQKNKPTLPIFPLFHLVEAPDFSFMKGNSSQGPLSAEGLIYETANGKQTDTWLFLRLIDGVYHDGKAIQIQIPLKQGYDSTSNSWEIPANYYSASLFISRKPLVKLDFKAVIKIDSKKQGSLTPASIKEQNLIVEIKSDSLYLSATLQPVVGGTHYFLIMTAINLIQLGLLLYFGRDQRVLFNTSQWLILQSSCLFIVQSLFMIKIALNHFDTPLFYLLFPALANILVLLMLLSKFQTVVEKFKNSKTFKLGVLFTLSYLLAVNYFSNNFAFWIYEGMIFMWQIVHSMRHGGSGGVSMQLVLVILLSRIPLISTLGSSQNIYKMNPDKAASNLLMVILVFHLFLIGVQKKFGSRIFVPTFLIPNFYDYRHASLTESEDAKRQCSICLNLLQESPEHIDDTEGEQQIKSSDATTENLENTKAAQKVFYAVTPCKHYYHLKCLSDWLETKLTCPLCKRGLPPMGVAA